MKHSPMNPVPRAVIEAVAVAGLGPAIDAVAASANPRNRFLTRSWFAVAVGSGLVTTLVGMRADGSAAIALPVSRRRWGLGAVPGCYWPHRGFPVVADLGDDELAWFLRSPHVRRGLGRVWRIGPIYADDPALLALKSVARQSGWAVVERRIATSFVLDIAAARAEGPWPRNSTLRKNRFHEKHLGEHGALEWRFISGAQWTSTVFDDLAAIEAKSWVGKAEGTDTKFLDPVARAFWEGLAADPAQAERMRAAMLYVGGEPAAFSFDLDVGETKYAIANSYDPAFAKHSPGKCLYYRNLIEAAERGIRFVDWGAGDSGYKTTLGAVPGAEIVDCLVVRPAILARVIAPLWARSGSAL
jgi:CelD/BcsL family acetyltransferase involved in cellulose biosynthesis